MVALAVLAVLTAALLASPVGAKKKGITKKKVKNIANNIVNNFAYGKTGADARFLNVDEAVTKTRRAREPWSTRPPLPPSTCPAPRRP